MSFLHKLENLKTRDIVAGAVIRRLSDGKILLLQRAKEDHYPLFWEFPRGHVKAGEEFFTGLKREVKEETNLVVVPVAKLGNFYYVCENETQKTIQKNFYCILRDEEQEIKISKEHNYYKWVGTKIEALLMCEDKLIKYVFNSFDIPLDKYS